MDRPREEWIEIPVPAIVTAERSSGPAAAGRQQAVRLPQHQGPLPAAGPGRLLGLRLRLLPHLDPHHAGKKIYYYRCLGSDDYRYEGGRVCGNKPVRADYLDTVVWDHITGLLADPALIRAEIGKRLQQARTTDPAARQRKRLNSRWPRPPPRSPR